MQRLSRNMRPTYAMQQVVDCRGGHSIFFGKNLVGYRAFFLTLNYFNHLPLLKLYVHRRLSKLSLGTIPVPSLFAAILRIVCSSAKEQMIGVAAWGIIAAMKNAKTMWNWTTEERPRHSVRQYVAAMVHKSVIQFSNHLRSCPLPTTVRGVFVDSRPKPVGKSPLKPRNLASNQFLSVLFRYWSSAHCVDHLINAATPSQA